MYLCINRHRFWNFSCFSGLMGGPAHLARELLGRHGPHKPYPGRAWARRWHDGQPGPARQLGRANVGRAYVDLPSLVLYFSQFHTSLSSKIIYVFFSKNFWRNFGVLFEGLLEVLNVN